LFCFISYFAIILDGVHLNLRATSATGTDSACLLLFFGVTLCVNKDVYYKSNKALNLCAFRYATTSPITVFIIIVFLL